MTDDDALLLAVFRRLLADAEWAWMVVDDRLPGQFACDGITHVSDEERAALLRAGAVTYDEKRAQPWPGSELRLVTAVEVREGYELLLTFDTGEQRTIDVSPQLWGPAFEALRADYELFRQVRVDPDAGTIVWPNGADLSPTWIYQHSVPVAP